MNKIKLIFTLLVVASTAVSASPYMVYMIGPLPGDHIAQAVSINDGGTVLVSSGTSFDARGAFTWNLQSGIEYVFPIGTVDAPGAIGNNGQVVGAYDDGHYWNAVIRNADGTITNLPSLPSEIGSCATSINDKGQIVGYSGNLEHAVIWNQDGRPVEIGGDTGWRSHACGINDSSEVVWNSSKYGSSAYLWNPTGNSILLNPLNNSDYTLASAINNLGQAVGTSGGHAILWNPDGSIAADLGVGAAYDINDLGQIIGMVGNRAIMWHSDLTTFDLGTLLDADNSSALSINDNGWIVGRADIPGVGIRAVIWEPVPEPAGVVALLCGLLPVAAGWRKRK